MITTRTPSPTSLLLAGIACFSLVATSCDVPQLTATPFTEDRVDLPDAPPDELIAVLEEAWEKASQLAEDPASGRRDALATGQLRTQVSTGIAAADKILADATATGSQQRVAREGKLDLLRIGANGRLLPGGRLEAYVSELVEADPQSELAAKAAATWLEHDVFSTSAPSAEVAPRLVEYAETYPTSASGVELFARYADLLDAKSDRAGAMNCLRVGISLYGSLPEAGVLQERLRKWERAEQSEALALAATQRAEASRIANLASKFGGYRDGYFVIYAEEKVAPPRVGIYFYRYDCDVVEGLEAAGVYVESLPKNWTWRVLKRFPQTPQGREQAYSFYRQWRKTKN